MTDDGVDFPKWPIGNHRLMVDCQCDDNGPLSCCDLLNYEQAICDPEYCHQKPRLITSRELRIMGSTPEAQSAVRKPGRESIEIALRTAMRERDALREAVRALLVAATRARTAADHWQQVNRFNSGQTLNDELDAANAVVDACVARLTELVAE